MINKWLLIISGIVIMLLLFLWFITAPYCCDPRFSSIFLWSTVHKVGSIFLVLSYISYWLFIVCPKGVLWIIIVSERDVLVSARDRSYTKWQFFKGDVTSFCLIVACMCVFRERTSRQAHAPVRAKKEDSEGAYLIFSGLIQWG